MYCGRLLTASDTMSGIGDIVRSEIQVICNWTEGGVGKYFASRYWEKMTALAEFGGGRRYIEHVDFGEGTELMRL